MWLDATDSEYRATELLAKIVLAGFTSEVPVMPFNRKYRNASHPFFQRVFQVAHSIDK